MHWGTGIPEGSCPFNKLRPGSKELTISTASLLKRWIGIEKNLNSCCIPKDLLTDHFLVTASETFCSTRHFLSACLQGRKHYEKQKDK